MPLSYRARLRRDLLDWEARGLIAPDQRRRIAETALRAPGLGYLQGVLVLCVLILLATAAIAFVAANWSGLAPVPRMAILFLADGAAVLVAGVAAGRAAREPTAARRAMADGAATLSLALAAATLALVAQTFHLPPDTQGFARSVAWLGLATALVARSGGAALVASAALLVADFGPWDVLLRGPGGAGEGAATFWVVLAGLFAGCLSGWLPARTANLLVLLIVLSNHVVALLPGRMIALQQPDLALALAVLALVAGRLLAGLPFAGRVFAGLPPAARSWASHLPEGGEALAQAAAGLCLLAIPATGLRTLFWVGSPRSLESSALLLALIFALPLALRGVRAAVPLADRIVLAAAAWMLVALWLGSGRHGGSPSATVWSGIVPALALVVAGHLDERRALFGGALTVAAGLIVAVLAVSGDLIGFAGHLLGSAILVALTLALCRWLDRRAGPTPAEEPA